MNKMLCYWQFAGFTAVSVLGSLLHFLYDWTQSRFAALISATNESTWEHMKLFFSPALLFAIAEWWYIGRKYPAFWCVKLQGILLGLVSIPVLFYTATGIFGTLPDGVNITIFFVAAALAFIFECAQLKKESTSCFAPAAAVAGLCLIAIAFFVFTFYPPHIPLFLDPVTQTYGLQ